MGLFSASQIEKINAVAAKSNETLKPASSGGSPSSINDQLNEASKKVLDYFKDSPAILIKNQQELHDYVDKCIEAGYAGIDTETTGLDRIHDKIVGASLYYPGGAECYIPSCHLIPIFEKPYPNQLSYEVIGAEFQRLVDNKVKLIFANADFDLAMIYKDLKVDMVPACFYDVILAWRCLREDEKDNTLKGLYAKYVKKGQVDPKKFTDFFSPKLFPYSKPEIAKLYAANDAKITYELFMWQLPYVTKSNPKCQKNHLEKIADLIWNIEFPMVRVCAHLHRRGMFLDNSIIPVLHERYAKKLEESQQELARDIQHLIDEKDVPLNRKRPFRTGADFNPNSQPHVMYLLKNLLGLDVSSTGKEVLNEVKDPSAKAILGVRKGVKLLGTYIDKMPGVAGLDNRIHCSFKSIGAATGRMSSESPNLQNIPSKLHDIRHMFRATPSKVETIALLVDSPTKFCSVDSLLVKGKGYTYIRDLVTGDVIECRGSDCTVCSNESLSKYSNVVRLVSESDITSVSLDVKRPHYVMMSSDYSQQEAKIAAVVSADAKFIDTFLHNRDIYATLASIGLGFPYEECLEFNPITGANQPEGKERRGVGKVLLLGINYGMSTFSIADMLFSDDDTMTEEEKMKKAEKIQQSLTKGFPQLQKAIADSQLRATKLGYTETILGRRRHHPDMQLPKYEFKPMKGYINPDVDPLDPSTLTNKEQIPERIIKQLTKEFNGYKYYGQRVKRTKELAEDKIKVIDNTYKISTASREVFNAVIQGSAADLTKIAMLNLTTDPEWEELNGYLINPVHDELIVEVPYEFREEGAKVLSRNMEKAGDFMPFPLKCDVETTFRWYGLSVDDVLSFEKPVDLAQQTLSESNIKWLQCMVHENEVELPKFKHEDGTKLEGIEAEGVNGRWSGELADAINQYKQRYQLHSDHEFLDHIEKKVIWGEY